MSLNKVVLVGNVGKDPVIRYFEKGVAKTTFPLATSESYTNQQGETVTSTEWHNIVFWRALAEVAEKTVSKGVQVYVSGKIKTRSYVDKEGNNKYITEILGDTLFTFEKKPVTGSYTSGKNTEPEVREQETGYKAESTSTDKPAGKNEFSEEGPFNAAHESGSNEDDLPF